MRTLLLLLPFALLPHLAPPAWAAPPADLMRAKQALERNPGDEDALATLVEGARTAGGLQALIAEYRQRAASGGDGRLRIVLAHLILATGDSDAALKEYDAAVARLPSSAAAHEGRATCLRRLDRWKDAADAYSKAARHSTLRSRKTALLIRAAKAALRGRDVASAQATYGELRKVDPANLFVRVEYARALAEAGRDAQALPIWTELLSAARGDAKIHVLALRETARVLARLGKQAEAIRLLRGALRRYTGDHWAVPDLQDALLEVYRQAGRLADYVRELEKGGRSYAASMLLARLYEETGADQKALALYRKLLGQRPANVDARNAILRIVKRSGNDDALLKEYQRVIRSAPGEPRYELELAALYYRLGRAGEGLALLDKLSHRHASDPGLREQIANVLRSANAPAARIRKEVEALVRLEPDEPRHLIELGELQFAAGAKDEAKRTWERLLKVMRSKPKAHLELARLMAEHGLLADADRHYAAAIAAAPTDLRVLKAYATHLEDVRRFADAARTWEKVLDLAGRQRDSAVVAEARGRLVQVLKSQGTLAARLRELEAQAAKDPEAALLLVAAYEELKELDKAARVLEGLVTRRPEDTDLADSLARIYEKLGRSAEALGVLERLAARAASPSGTLLKRMARLAVAANRIDDAVAFAKRRVDLNPADAEAVRSLAELYVRIQRQSDALTAYRKAAALDPKDMRARLEIARILRSLGQDDALMRTLVDVVRTAREPRDVLSAGRRVIAQSRIKDLEAFEPVLTQLMARSPKQPVYRRLLVELYSAHIRRLDVARERDPAGAARQLRALRDRGLKPLLDSLGDADTAIRMRVLRVLREIRPQSAVLQLTRLLDDKDRLQTLQVMGVLAHIGAPTAIPAIARQLASKDRAVRATAVWALGAFPQPESLAALQSVVADRQAQSYMPLLLALSLGARGRADALPALTKLLEEGSTPTKEHAAWALGMAGDPRAVAPLREALADAPGALRRAIIWALGAIASPRGLEPALRAALEGDADLAPVARWACGRIVGRAPLDRAAIREAFLALQGFERGGIRLDGVLATLARWDAASGPDAASLRPHAALLAKTLTATLSRGEPTARADRLLVLADGPDGLHLGPLAPETRVEGALLETVRAAATRALSDADADVRAAAARVLGRAGGAPVEPLAAALRDPAVLVRHAAAEALGQTGRPGALDAILGAAPDLSASWRGRVALCRALGRLAHGAPAVAERAGKALAPLLKDRFPSVRVEALHAVASARPTAAHVVERVLERLEDADTRVVLAAIDTVGALRPAAGRAALERSARHADPEVRARAKAALLRLSAAPSGS